jgi:hypothetical protein
MKDMKRHEGAQGWEPGIAGLHDQGEDGNEHTQRQTPVCSLPSSP